MSILITIHAKSRGGLLLGTSRNEIFQGSSRIDLIYAGSGQDWLYGYGGNDLLNGEQGNDYLYGGIGNDELYGGRKGTTYVDDGDDYLYGGSGNDKLFGGTGNDYLSGENDNDYLEGGTGDDTLLGGMGSDILVGGSGNDLLTGGANIDWFSFSNITGSIDRVRDFTYGEDKILLKATDFGLTTTTAVPAGHPLAGTIFPSTPFYRLNSSEFEVVASLATATRQIVVVSDALPTGSTTNPATLYFNNGGTYEQLAVFDNGVIPGITGTSDFLVY
ncbi:MAG: calcium-binding protein [Snowella sp.]|nr:calcium-binding protein [Snowella sp.]